MRDFCPSYSAELMHVTFWWKFVKNFDDKNLSNFFWSEMKFCKIDPCWVVDELYFQNILRAVQNTRSGVEVFWVALRGTDSEFFSNKKSRRSVKSGFDAVSQFYQNLYL
jgi:hypothetical protein